VLSLGLINERIFQVLRAVNPRHFTGVFTVVMGLVGVVGDRSARVGRNSLGSSLSSAGRATRHPFGCALLAQCNNYLRARKYYAGAAVAAHGGFGGRLSCRNCVVGGAEG
jgi:hypothetical protein